MARAGGGTPQAAVKQGKRKPRKGVFSAVKAVKANARERVGTPPAGRVITSEKARSEGKPRHKETLGKLLLPE